MAFQCCELYVTAMPAALSCANPIGGPCDYLLLTAKAGARARDGYTIACCSIRAPDEGPAKACAFVPPRSVVEHHTGMVPRIQFFEWNDQPWLPETLRRSATEYLATMLDIGRPFSALAPKLAGLLGRHGDRVIDLAAGGAGPWGTLRDEVTTARGGRAPDVTLTDLYPNARAARRGLSYEPAAVDARAVPARLVGVRTMFDGLHHFAPDEARAVLADACRNHAPILVADATNRRLVVVLASLVLVPLFVLLVTPFVRPLSGWRLLFTYVVPVLPLLITWDGVVSCLRTYTPDELRALTARLDGFSWETGELRTRGAIVTYLIGEPRG